MALGGLELRNVTKSFGAFRALSSVDFRVGEGEVLALLGENGSGKSTLVKILAGYYLPDPGAQAFVAGRELAGFGPNLRRELGVSFVFQDLALAPRLSVLENLTIVRRSSQSRSGLGVIDWRGERARAAALLGDYGVELRLDSAVGSLPPVGQAMLAIVRAAEQLRARKEQGHALLVLDEPTVFLPEEERAFLIDLVRRVRDDGTSVVLVSHDLTTVRAVADRAVVLRDGRLVGDVEMGVADEPALVRLITGDTRSGETSSSVMGIDARPGSAERALAVARLETKRLRGVSFEVHRGEIVGVAGLLGSGVEELPYALFNSRRDARGDVRVYGDALKLTGEAPLAAMRLGMGLVPADRRRDGGVSGVSAESNMFLLALSRFTWRGLLSWKRIRTNARARFDTFDIRPRNPRTNFGILSGGNQQKVVLAKWLEQHPRVLLLHEPTQGVDVGARAEIHRIAKNAASEGVAIVWVSTDFAELSTLSDRVMVFSEGALVDILSNPGLDKERITSAVFQAKESRGG